MPEHCPTVRELAEMGHEYAYATDWVKARTKREKPTPTRWHVTAKGYALMGAAMRANALEAIARGEGDWQPAPSRTDIQERIAKAAALAAAQAEKAQESSFPHCQHCSPTCSARHAAACEDEACWWMLEAIGSPR